MCDIQAVVLSSFEAGSWQLKLAAESSADIKHVEALDERICSEGTEL